MGLVRVEGDGSCLLHCMVIHSDYSCSTSNSQQDSAAGARYATFVVVEGS